MIHIDNDRRKWFTGNWEVQSYLELERLNTQEQTMLARRNNIKIHERLKLRRNITGYEFGEMFRYKDHGSIDTIYMKIDNNNNINSVSGHTAVLLATGATYLISEDAIIEPIESITIG